MRWLLVIFCFWIFTASASAQDRAAVERQFQQWLQDTIWPMARSKGVSRRTMTRAFDGVRLNWDLPDLRPPGSAPKIPKQQRQAEFGAPSKYFNAGTVQNVTSTGRQMARRHAGILSGVEYDTGVPSGIILAIWGRESGFGRVPIRHDAIGVLATKGFMSTRSDYFTEELIAALQIAETGQAQNGRLKSSWAGALGQPQFMPSNYLTYAVDGDGDGRVDIWSSPQDTIASIGNFLAEHGWIRGRDWGFEVKVPASISCAMEGPDQGMTIQDWADLGIARVSGKPFPPHELDGQAYLMMPAGRNGPAFLVTPNFYVLKDYNKSDLYALFVGHVGDRIDYGVGNFHGRWGKVGRMYRSDIAAMQRALEEMGHDVGGADGLPGYKTRRSIGRWQKAAGFVPTCFPDVGMKDTLTK